MYPDHSYRLCACVKTLFSNNAFKHCFLTLLYKTIVLKSIFETATDTVSRETHVCKNKRSMERMSLETIASYFKGLFRSDGVFGRLLMA